METNSDTERASLLAQVQRIQAKQMALRSWLITRLGEAAGTVAAAAVSDNPVGELDDELLHLGVMHGWGLPPNVTLTHEQIIQGIRMKRAEG